MLQVVLHYMYTYVYMGMLRQESLIYINKFLSGLI